MKLKTQLMLGYLAVFAIMLIVSSATFRGNMILTETAQWVAHTHEVIGGVKEIEKLLIDMETGERGFLLTGREEFLEPYHGAHRSFESKLADIRILVSDNSPQVARLDEIKAGADRWVRSIAEPEIALRREVKDTESSMLTTSTRIGKAGGKALMDDLRVRLGEVIDVERDLLSVRDTESEASIRQSTLMVIVGTLLAIVLGIISMLVTSRAILRPVVAVKTAAGAIAAGTTGVRVDIKGAGEFGEMGAAINDMAARLEESAAEREHQSRVKTAQTDLSDRMRGDPDMEELCQRILTQLTDFSGAELGLFYAANEEGVLHLAASVAHVRRKDLATSFRPGEGLVGQAAKEHNHILLEEVPENYLRIDSGLGATAPANILVVPLLAADRVEGVVELGSLRPVGPDTLELLAAVTESIALAMASTRARERTQELLEQTQEQAEELETQQEELRLTNDQLTEQAEALKVSEEGLQAQQEELRVTNEELQEKTQILQDQRDALEVKHAELGRAQEDLEEKARELGVTSRYKSQFLANMSHELRTPLNSLLILARDLTENRKGNLDDGQIEAAEVIYNSGKDLLTLINDILDLAKVEAGKLTLAFGPLYLDDAGERLRATFTPMAEANRLAFEVAQATDAPERIETDDVRLQQILKNLVSNALKFTREGRVTVRFRPPTPEEALGPGGVAMDVEDTGVGIPEDQQAQIFEAFRQVDGSSSRLYGGAGLGLTISRELAALLGGTLGMRSTQGEGSIFTLVLPARPPAASMEDDQDVPVLTPAPPRVPTGAVPAAHPDLQDDREDLQPDDRVLLVVEDDLAFARILRDYVRERGFKVLCAQDGEAGLALVSAHSPAAVLLDIRLPGMNGWEVLRSMKRDPETRHILVHVLSVEERSLEAFRQGIVGYTKKPASREDLDAVLGRVEELMSDRVKHVLVVEDDPVQRRVVVDLVTDASVRATAVATGQEALDCIADSTFDCMILDLGLPDMDGFELLDRLEGMEAASKPPVVVYTGRELTEEETDRIQGYASSIVLKDVRSEDRLLDETALFLHRVVDDLPPTQKKIIHDLYDPEELIQGKRVLVVDDDMRNVFAVTRVLEERGMEVFKGANGRKALELLDTQEVDLVLMDMMMPEMDGYEATRRIRNDPKLKHLPVIALTAKAMKEDRSRCLEAGANDYMAKPVDMNRLLSLLRVWLQR